MIHYARCQQTISMFNNDNDNYNDIIILYAQAVDGRATKAEFAAPHLSPTCACHTG